MHDEEINNVLHTLMQQQDEMLVLMKAMHSKIIIPEEEVWLTQKQVQEMLFIERRTFYRRRAECNWERKRIGGQWYYLKSSVLGK